MNQNTQAVLRYFKELCRIPRPSGHESQVRDYLKTWAQEQGYSYTADEAGNLIIDCKPRAGYEHRKTVILQAHMDMVCVAEGGTVYDPPNDPIEVIEEGDYLHADKTSLGGDDGIGIAIAQYLAVHCTRRGPLRLIFTADEEETTSGAIGLDNKHLDAPYLINLDSEISDKVIISSAGCMELSGEALPLRQNAALKNGFRLKIRGLKGGHSGDDIDKGRANAILLGAQVMRELEVLDPDWELCSFSGGAAANAIPMNAVICGNAANMEQWKAAVQTIYQRIKKQYPQEPQLEIILEPAAANETAIHKARIVDFLLNLPCGVIAMSKSVNGLVGTSLNLGILKMDGDNCLYKILIRGEIETDILELAGKIETMAASANLPCQRGPLTPSWPADKKSRLLGKLQTAYQTVTNRYLEPIAIHAVLECAEFRAKNRVLDMVSISPDVYDVHSAQERLYIPSVGKILEVLEELLEKL